MKAFIMRSPSILVPVIIEKIRWILDVETFVRLTCCRCWKLLEDFDREHARERENVCVWEMRNEKDTYSWELKSMKDTVLIKSSKKRDKITGRKKGKKEKRKYWETRLDARACVKEREWTEEVWEWKRRNVTSNDREISYEHFFLHFAARRII